MTIYIFGLITGKAYGNLPLFEECQKDLEAQGTASIIPHDLTADHSGPCLGREIPGDMRHRYGCYLRAQFRALLNCEGIVLLPGWRISTDSIHVGVATAIGLPVWLYNPTAEKRLQAVRL